MANNKMLIDATHEEETRVVVVKGNKIEEFDFEAANRRQLKGNIYLAKVTRVEPSLQAAFVDFGGNRHGFLAFSEIHPDYYQIPASDRAELLRAEREAAAEAKREEALRENEGDAETAEPAPKRGGRYNNNNRKRGRRNNTRFVRRPARGIFTSLPPITPAEPAKENTEQPVTANPDAKEERPNRSRGGRGYRGRGRGQRMGSRPLRGVYTSLPPYVSALNEATPFEKYEEKTAAKTPTTKTLSESSGTKRNVKSSDLANESGVQSIFDDTSAEAEQVDIIDNNDDATSEEAAAPVKRKARMSKRYEIQQVIKRRQIILVQVVKEERGNKGAALTTYLSLAGRYCVLMPNTPKGGGISRKITNMSDRKRLKEVAEGLVLDEGMGLIVRTAGANRTKIDIQRDYEYLIRLWETVRNLTLRSVAPYLVYEEGNLIKRSIRDLYDREIDNVIVSGEKAFKDAKAFMTMLMPTHAKKVIQYTEPQPIFIRHHIEQQLDSIYSPNVTLKSGGYLVINQTEALVSIDINSGKSTKENSIENTAVNTNLEAAEEIARQLRLRDLAGLVVIDFIDMEESRNNRAVEKKIKDCLSTDRARIQVGRISHFGLLEMSRQRLRASLLEGSTDMCPHCHGTGLIRSNSSMALHILNALEHQLIQGRGFALNIFAPLNITMFLLNNKRQQLFEIEERYNARVNIEVDPHLEGVSYRIETSEEEVPLRKPRAVRLENEYGSNEKIEAKTAEIKAEKTVEDPAPGYETSDGESDEKRPKRENRRKQRPRNTRSRTKPDNTVEDKNQDSTDVAKTETKPEQADANASQEKTQEGKVNAKEAVKKPKTRAKRPTRGTKTAENTAKTEEKPTIVAEKTTKTDEISQKAAVKATKSDVKSPKSDVKASETVKKAEPTKKAETVQKKDDTKPAEKPKAADATAKQGWWSRRFSRS